MKKTSYGEGRKNNRDLSSDAGRWGQFHRPTLRASAVLLTIWIVLALLSLMLGDQMIPLNRAWQALMGQGSSDELFIIQSLRAPRLIMAFLVGAALAVSGAVLQAVIRNPLAAPDVIGISGGASVGALAFITYLSSYASIYWMPVASIIGAFLAAGLVYWLAWRDGVHPLRLVLVGIGISSLLSALTSFMLVFSPSYSATSSYIWLTGTIYGSSWTEVIVLLPWVICFMLLLYVYRGAMNVQLLGDELAVGLGSRVQRNRLLLIAISVGLAGAAVSVGGVIGFVGLIAPHMARKLVGPVSWRLLPVAALTGGAVVALADLVARTAFLPLDIPVGVFTSGIGAPFFIYLLYRTRNQR
ncbi:FecCD family ABC transporter permease [Paenibacillus sp. 1001270B_150601_E10]|uniref:FecCD family ABC transporter permease n=1 Tax=Paenibacillus sp. 1001270B_150601_E10 TaxID=2787079 RepID=UPI0018A009EA|nr:iron ABC transporter permease [Paenibacillus sp. 1001270B_150601_E10]